jgi:hypothetical protein
LRNDSGIMFSFLSCHVMFCVSLMLADPGVRAEYVFQQEFGRGTISCYLYHVFRSSGFFYSSYVFLLNTVYYFSLETPLVQITAKVKFRNLHIIDPRISTFGRSLHCPGDHRCNIRGRRCRRRRGGSSETPTPAG